MVYLRFSSSTPSSPASASRGPTAINRAIGTADPTPFAVLETEMSLPLSAGSGVMALGMLQNGTSDMV